jgi:ATP-dependent RNA helicase DOB1
VQLHYTGGDGLYLVVDEQGQFREANFQKSLAALSAGSSKGDGGGGGGGGKKPKTKFGGQKGRAGGHDATKGADMYKIIR